MLARIDPLYFIIGLPLILSIISLIIHEARERYLKVNCDPDFAKNVEMFENRYEAPILNDVLAVFKVRVDSIPLEGDEKIIIRPLILEELASRVHSIRGAKLFEEGITKKYREGLTDKQSPHHDLRDYRKAHLVLEKALKRFYYARDLAKLMGFVDIPEKWEDYGSEIFRLR